MTRTGEPLKHFQEHLYDQTDECMIWPYGTRGQGGYGQLFVDGRQQGVHVLACEAHHGPRPEGTEAAHGPCHDPRCWNGRHLSWKTHQENMRDKERDGTWKNRAHGERAAKAKLTEEAVLAIRERYEKGGTSQRTLAQEHGVTLGAINQILLRKTWTHI